MRLPHASAVVECMDFAPACFGGLALRAHSCTGGVWIILVGLGVQFRRARATHLLSLGALKRSSLLPAQRDSEVIFGILGYFHIATKNTFLVYAANPKNNSYDIPPSRGHNLVLKNAEFFEIYQKFAEIGRFEFGIFRETTDFPDFPRFA